MIDHARGHQPVRHRRERLHRRRLVAVVQRPRAPAPRRSTRRSARQLGRVAHTTMLGLSHEPAIELAERLVRIAPPGLSRVFYSDSGSTAVEVGAQDGLPVVGTARRARAHRLHLPRERLPRRHGRLGLGRRDRAVPLALPAAPVRHLAGPGRRRRPPRRAASATRRPRRGGDRRAAGPGCGRDADAARRATCARVRELCDAPRRAADLRRGGDRVRAHRHDVRVRARAGLARPPLRRQGDHRRLPAARRDAHDRARVRGLPRPVRGPPDLLPRAHVHGQRARLRGRDRDARDLRARADARGPAAEDRAAPPPARPSHLDRSPGSPRSASAGSWSESS